MSIPPISTTVYAQMEKLITENKWMTVNTILKGRRGEVDTDGKRYCVYQSLTSPSIEIDWVCTKIFEASQSTAFAIIPPKSSQAVINTIKELRRMYDQSEKELSFVNRAIDITGYYYEMNNDELPIEKLERVVIPYLRSGLTEVVVL